MDWVQALVPLVTGGLAGAAVNAFITARKQKLEVTLSITKDFFAIYDKIGQVKGILESPSPDIEIFLNTPQCLNTLRHVGDWFHYIASLIKKGIVDVSLLKKVGIITQIEEFSKNISSAKDKRLKQIEDAWIWWSNLENFRGNEVILCQKKIFKKNWTKLLKR